MIGKFEEHCLMALIRSGSNSLASRIFETLCEHTGEEFQFGSVYTTLDRMVDKKWVNVEMRQSKTGARSRRHFSITGLGEEVLNQSLSGTRKLASGIVPGFSLEGSV